MLLYCVASAITNVTVLLLHYRVSKRKNTSWTSVQTIVIDMDFVEWRVLENAFPDAKVILCQSHALTYWRKVWRRAKHNLTMAQHENMETSFAKLIYWYVLDCCLPPKKFESEVAVFSKACKEESPELLKYFTTN
ncbi:hypothetical protein PHPALM_31532 [Phytophthora palmivora]|uniref:ZSWIM1/3 RNaseH-like domain-containing protein n=1 Tax=Phytophthora palmivora TaxID=4796 RepID=A0A2P4X2B9_9STRA|nr:hypothetical protein PHPALM_31532 [Phytophthora palmivora]